MKIQNNSPILSQDIDHSAYRDYRDELYFINKRIDSQMILLLGASSRYNHDMNFKCQPFPFASSIQKIHFTQSAIELTRVYFNWLNRLTLGLIHYNWKKTTIFLFNRIPLIRFDLVLMHYNFVSLKVIGGLLGFDGIFSFKRSPFHFNICLISLVGFRPRYPWLIYRFTQAKLHTFIMNLFTKRMDILIKNKKIKNVKQQG